MTTFGIAKDYEYSATHKREKLDIWEGSFFSSWSGDAFSLPKGDGYMVTTYNGDKVRVECPTPRTDSNYMEIDKAINEALNTHFDAKGRKAVAEAATV